MWLLAEFERHKLAEMDLIKGDVWLFPKQGHNVYDGGQLSLLQQIYRDVQMANQVVLVKDFVAELATNMEVYQNQLGSTDGSLHRTEHCRKQKQERRSERPS